MRDGQIVHRRLLPEDAAALRTLRLSGLRESPSAFSADEADEASRTVDGFREWIAHPHSVYFAAFDDERMVGMLCLTRESRAKLAHKAMIRSVYVAPSHRGRGIAIQLLQDAITHARTLPGLQRLILTVTADNHGARQLYEVAGFVCHGVEPQALQVDGVWHDEAAYSLDLSQPVQRTAR